MIDLPAGKTVFDTLTPPNVGQLSAKARNKAKIPLLREARQRWEIDPFYSGPASAQVEEEDSRRLAYELDVDAPPFLTQGHNSSLSLSIRVLNQSMDLLPVKLAISAHTLASYPWAASFGATPDVRKRILWLDSDAGERLEEHRTQKQHRARKFNADDFDEDKAFDRDYHYFMGLNGQPPSSAHDIEGRTDGVHRFELPIKV
jgi:hypothetical protein